MAESAITERDTLRGIVYLGNRSNNQNLAIPLATQNGGNGRFYFPAPERSVLVGASASYAF